jgi:uncharacterized protein
MSLKTQIDADIKSAMLAKDQPKLLALRAVKSMILLESTKTGSGEISLDDELKMLMRAVKQRKESAETYIKSNRQDLADKELAEVGYIEVYLPKQLSEEDLKAKISEIITRVGAVSASDLGKVMGVASKELAGIAEGKAISAMTKNLLA